MGTVLARGNTMNETELANLKSRLTQSILGVFGNRLRDSRPLKLDLDDLECCLHRFRRPTSSLGLKVALAKACASKEDWRTITRLHDILYSAVEEVLQGQKALDWTAATLPFTAVFALRFAERLRVQMNGSGPPLVDEGRLPGDHVKAFSDCAQAAEEAAALPTITAMQFTHSLRQAMVDSGVPQAGKSKRVLFRRDQNEINVTWLTDTGTVVGMKSLDTLVHSALDAILPGVCTRLERLETLVAECRKIANALLPCVDSSVSEVLRAARAGRGSIGLRLFSATLRGAIPAEVWLFPRLRDWDLNRGVCTLAVSRAHHEFILEAIDGLRYYFPPIQIRAEFHFVDPRPHLVRPVVWQPPGGFSWVHPYTGELSRDPSGDTLERGHTDFAMFEPSDWARRTFPSLKERCPCSMVRDLCLEGQEEDLARLQRRLDREMASLFPPDVLSIVTELHTLARHGLCRAHQLNQATPRVPMCPRPMLYPVPPGDTGKVRVFPYDPRDPGQIGSTHGMRTRSRHHPVEWETA